VVGHAYAVTTRPLSLSDQRRKPASQCSKDTGDQQRSSQGQLAYGEAKANFDAAIAELTTSLTEGGNPKSLPSLETDERGTSWTRRCQAASATTSKRVLPSPRVIVGFHLYARLGLRPEDVFINLIEVQKENWSFGNGIAQYAD
jgi:hypothetical protein